MSEVKVHRLRKRPVTIEAMQFDGSAESATPIIDWVLAGGGTARYDEGDPDVGIEPSLAVDTLEGTMRGTAGWWIARGVEGEFYPIKPSVVEATYDVDPPDDGEAVAEARRALQALLLAVPHEVAADVRDRVEAAFAELTRPGLGKPGSQVPLGLTNFDEVQEQIRAELEQFLLRHVERLFYGVKVTGPHAQALVLSRVADALAGSGTVWNDHTERLELLEDSDRPEEGAPR